MQPTIAYYTQMDSSRLHVVTQIGRNGNRGARALSGEVTVIVIPNVKAMLGWFDDAERREATVREQFPDVADVMELDASEVSQNRPAGLRNR